jgi:chromosome segregation ATPase
MAGSPAEAVTLEQYGELEVKVIKLRRALAHAQSVTKRQDAALSKTINRLQALDEEVQELKDEGSRLEDEIQNLENELESRRNLPEMSQKDYTEKEIAAARREIEDLAFERAKVMVEIEKQKLCNREISKTVEIVKQRYEHEGKKRRHEIRKLDATETALRKEIDNLKKEKNQLLGTGSRNSGNRDRSQSDVSDSRRESRLGASKNGGSEGNSRSSRRPSGEQHSPYRQSLSQERHEKYDEESFG